MSFAKESQSLSLDGIDVLLSPLGDEHKLDEKPEETLDVALLDVGPAGELVAIGPTPKELIVEDEPEADMEVEEPELVLTLDLVPGGLFQDEIEEPAELEVEEPEEVVVNNDPWDWGTDHSKFLPWLSKMMQSTPPHSGKDTVGLERTIARFERLNKEVSRAVRTDLHNKIDIVALEKARDEIIRCIERLEERLEKVQQAKNPKKKKKTKRSEEEQTSLVKEAQKATHVGGIVVAVPLFISGLARVCINGMVSGGHDIEDMFKKLSKKFDLTSREQFEMMQLLADMGYPVRRDRGFLLDEEHDPSAQDGFDWNQNFSA